MLDTDNILKGSSDCVKYKERLYLLYHTYLFSECPIIRLRDVPMWCPGTSLYDVRQFCCFFVVIPCWWHCPIYPVYHVLTLCPYMMIMKKNISGLPQRRSGDVHIWGPGTFQQKVRQSFFMSGPCFHLWPSPGHVGRSLLPIFENVDNFGKFYNPVHLWQSWQNSEISTKFWNVGEILKLFPSHLHSPGFAPTICIVRALLPPLYVMSRDVSMWCP